MQGGQFYFDDGGQFYSGGNTPSGLLFGMGMAGLAGVGLLRRRRRAPEISPRLNLPFSSSINRAVMGLNE